MSYGTAPASGTPGTPGSLWRYKTDLTSATIGGIPTSWKNEDFNDAGWNTGPTQIGYGDVDEHTQVPRTDYDAGTAGTQSGPSYLFRKTFTITNVNAIESLTGEVKYDDGAVVYVNGTEILRTPNLDPAGTLLNYANFNGAGPPPDNSVSALNVPLNLLHNGVNTIAVEVHQASSISSDMTFDLKLQAEDAGCETHLYPPDLIIPDGDPVGTFHTVTVSSAITNLADVNVLLRIDGTWNGDLHVVLTHGPAQAVLLNRVGRITTGGLGYDDDGVNIRLDDQAALGDVHVYRLTLNGSHGAAITGALTDDWAPDGRATNPTAVLATDPRTALLNQFNGLDANGPWTLRLFDLKGGDPHTLVDWGLELCGNVPPAPNLSIGWFTIDGGGGTSTNGTLAVSGTIGQPDAGKLSGGTLAIKGGFWGVITAIQTPGAPLLTITLNSQLSTVTVSWPSPSTGFNLQQNNDLNTANWVAPMEPVTDNGTNNSIVVNPPVGNRFYRLSKP